MTVQTLPFYSLIQIDRASASPVYQQVANGLEQLISKGTLKPGYQLPSSRELAGMMKLNRTTVVAAYEELSTRGWIKTVPRKGVTVADKLPELTPRAFHMDELQKTVAPVKFHREITAEKPRPVKDKPFFKLVVNDGYPDARVAPLSMLISRYKSLLNKHQSHTSLINEQSSGAASLRYEISSFLSKTRGIAAAPDNILTARGAQGAIYIAAQMIVKPGSKVIVGELNYSMANKVFRELGATLIKVGIDEHGIDVDMIESICKTAKPDLLYVIPHHHHPTTVTLSAERRARLLQIIQTYQLPVIEDDYDYDFHYDNSPILPLASADHNGLILYIGSITKTLALTIRSGYLVANTALIWQAGKLKELMELRGDYLMEDAIAYLFKSGEMQRHITKSVKLYRERRNIFCELLSTQLNDVLHFKAPQGGMAVWALFKPDFPLSRISADLAKQHIYLNDGSLYNQGNAALNGVRLGFASMNESEMKSFVMAVRRSAGI